MLSAAFGRMGKKRRNRLYTRKRGKRIRRAFGNRGQFLRVRVLHQSAIGEYKNSHRKPVIRVGSKESYAGKILVVMSGLTGPGPKILKEYFEAGVGTLVMMHIPEKDAKELKEQNIGNVVIAGHTSSDSLGLNKIAELWEKKGVKTTMMSGIIEA